MQELLVVLAWCVHLEAEVDDLAYVMTENVLSQDVCILSVSLTLFIFTLTGCHALHDMKHVSEKLHCRMKLLIGNGFVEFVHLHDRTPIHRAIEEIKAVIL